MRTTIRIPEVEGVKFLENCRTIVIVWAIFLVGFLGGCAPQNEGPLNFQKGWSLAVSNPPQAWLATKLVGDRAKVLTLVPSGKNEHLYEPSAKELQQLVKSKLIFSLGLGFETVLAQKISSTTAGLKLIDVGKEFRTIELNHHDHDGHHHHGEGDPHIWLSPKVFIKLGKTMTKHLKEFDPQNGPIYSNNLKTVVKELSDLENTFMPKLKELKGKTFFTVHPSLSYLARDYGFKIISLEREGKDPSSKRIQELKKVANNRGVSAILVQKAFNEGGAVEFSKLAGLKVLYIDTMQDNYPKMMMEICDQLVMANGGETP